MRFFYLTILLSIVFISQSLEGARAAIWVEQLTGNSQSIIISRKGDFLQVEEMMRLLPGDIVKVTDGKSSVRILLGSGEVKNISKARSPFTVAGKDNSNSFLANLMGEVKKMLVVSADETQAVAMITRGDGVLILADKAEQNFVLSQTGDLLVVWQGCHMPYALTLDNTDLEKIVIEKKGIGEQRFALNMMDMEDGEYTVQVQDSAKIQNSSNTLNLTLASASELPADAQKLLALKLDKRVEARLLINLLRDIPEWRFYIYSLAITHDLEAEQKFIERKQKIGQKKCG